MTDSAIRGEFLPSRGGSQPQKNRRVGETTATSPRGARAGGATRPHLPAFSPRIVGDTTEAAGVSTEPRRRRRGRLLGLQRAGPSAPLDESGSFFDCWGELYSC